MKKIIEHKAADFLKGISLYANAAVGGLFQALNNIDPFEAGGLALPSLTPDNQTLNTVPKFLTNFNTGGSGYLYVQTPTKLYQVTKDTPYTVTDKTANITVDTAVNGATIWKGRYIYVLASSMRSSVIPVAADDVQIRAGFNATLDFVPLCVGADGNLYNGDNNKIGVNTNASGSNSTTYNIDTGFTVRDLVSDGRYLVIIADNNAVLNSGKITGKYQCKVYFWDMVQTDANSRIVPDAIWDIEDSYLIGVKFKDGAVYVFGYNGIYICNIATQPKLVYPFPLYGTVRGMPYNPAQISISKNSLFWLDGTDTTLQGIFALGNPVNGQPKIFYLPFVYSGGYTAQCLTFANDKPILGTNQAGLFFFRVGSTRGTGAIQTLNLVMEQPYTYGLTKVVLKQPLASGQSVTVTANAQNGSVTLSSETKTFASVGAKQTLVFKRIAAANAPDKFEDIAVTVSHVGAAIARVSTYATPLEDINEFV